MIERLSPYPTYRSTGLTGLASVPAGWDIERAKIYYREVDERSATGAEELLSVSHKTGVTPRREKTVSMFMAESHVGYKLCRPGDIAVNTMWAWMAALGVSRHLGIVSPSYGVYRPRGERRFLQPYLDELLRTPGYTAEYNIRSTGITSSRLRLYPDVFLRIPLVCPPLDEQAAIVRFLDHADRRIRKYIRAKQQLIKLLEEQKRAIIHQAVTRGLDPSVRLKPSGVDWLGDVPEHWVVERLGFLGAIGNGSTPARSNPLYWVGGTYPWLNSACVNRGRVSDANQFVTTVALRECHLPRVRPGSLLIAITGQGKTRGTTAILEVEATINQHLAFFTPRSPYISIDYLQMVFIAAYLELRHLSDAAGSTKGALTCRDISNFKFALPPRAEQDRILATLHLGASKCTDAISQAMSEITLLREYRTRLFSDVLTGQLDVRAAAAALPDDLSEAESLDDVDAGEEDSLDADELAPEEDDPR